MHRKKHIWCAVMIILITAFDQMTKFFAQKYLSDGASVQFIKGVVDFRYAENTGMALLQCGIFFQTSAVLCGFIGA